MARDVKADLLDFLQANLDFTDVSVPASEITVDHANYDGGLDYPGVFIATENTTTPGSGPTGYTGMHGGGGGPTQDPVTTVQVDCWSGHKQLSLFGEYNTNPDSLANELGWLVWDTIRENANAMENQGYPTVGVTAPTEANDTETSPTVYRRIVPVALAYHLGPSTT